MTNPYESPQSPFEPTEPPLTGRTVGMFLAGFLSALLMTFVGTGITIAFAIAVASGLTGPLASIVFFLCSPVVVGPICSIVLWRLTRNSNRPFAMGAVASGVAVFLLIGGCFMAFSV